MTWHRVTHRQLCPICGKDHWCMISADGAAVICPRIESGFVLRHGKRTKATELGDSPGWWHWLTGDRRITVVLEDPPAKLGTHGTVAGRCSVPSPEQGGRRATSLESAWVWP